MNKPGELQGIQQGAFSLLNCIGEFVIPESMFLIEPGAFSGATIGSFNVDPDNQVHSNDDNGILYAHRLDVDDGSKQEANRIIMAPNKKVEHIDIPDTISIIDTFAFFYYTADTITIPTSLQTIGDNAFPCFAINSTDKFDAVYYEGTIDQWNEIYIGGMNGRITKAHLYCNDWYNISEQTCTTAEIQRRDCHCSDDCTAYETRETKPSLGGHNFTEQLGAVRSTCKTQGYIEYHCSRCDRVKEYEPLDKTNHEGPYGTRNAKSATCITAGKLADTYCTACGVTTEFGAETDPPIGEHIMEAYRTTDSATCKNKGYKYMRCKYYNTCYQMTRELVESDPTCHYSINSFGLRNKVTATCCTEGYSGDYYCKDCNNNLHTCKTTYNYKPDKNCNGCLNYWVVSEKLTQPRILKATGKHTFGDWYTTLEPTCIAKGEERRDCTVGEAFEINALPINSEAHAYYDVWTVSIAPNCIAGEEERFCKLCGKGRQTREIEANVEHVWKNWVRASASTCTTQGEQYRFCKNCTAKETELLPLIEHRYFHFERYIISKVDPTCTTPGVANYGCVWYEECKTTESGELPVVKHVFENYEVITPATCINIGIKTAKCKWYDECHETENDTIACTGTHIFDKPYESLRGQCDREGYIKYKCTADPDCTEIKTKTLAINPEFHNSGYNFDVNIKDATCCVDGYSGDTTCIGCGEVIYEGAVITATGEHVLRTEEREGNCVSKGAIIYICTLSNLRIKSVDTVFMPDNHGTLKTVNQKVPTCQSKGYTGDKQCVLCKKIIEKGNETSYGKHDIRTNGKCHVCGTAVCSHMCHKNNNQGNFWYKFCLFFWKLFKTNKICSCGRMHY